MMSLQLEDEIVVYLREVLDYADRRLGVAARSFVCANGDLQPAQATRLLARLDHVRRAFGWRTEPDQEEQCL